MYKAVEQALVPYELPQDCRNRLQEELFRDENFAAFIASYEPYEALCLMVSDICRTSPDCDIETLQVEEIADLIAEKLYWGLMNDHELMTVCNFYQLCDVHKNTKDIRQEQLQSKFVPERMISKEDASELSCFSAEKISAGLSKYLFAEEAMSVKKTLEDVYVESHFGDAEKEFCNFEELYSELGEEEPLLIEGDAGMGKSTFVMKLAQKYLAGTLFSEQKVFFVCGKELRVSKGNPVDDIKKVLNIRDEESFVDSVLILDAYDEIAYASKSQEQNQAYLQKLCQDLEVGQLILTCRSDYIRSFSGKRVSLLGFSAKQRLEFLEKYNSGKCQEECLSKENIEKLSGEYAEDEEVEDIEDLLEIPMLLYMVAVSGIDLRDITDRYSLYERVFGSENALRKNRKISKSIWKNCHILAQRIAHQMFLRNDSYIGQQLIYRQIELMNLPMEDMNVLKNCFGIEIFLRGEEDRLYTFVHASIYEYFAAKWICGQFRDILLNWLVGGKDYGVFVQALNEIFSADYFNEKVFRYIMENIKNGYYNSSLLTKEEYVLKSEQLMNQVLRDQLCTSGDEAIPHIIRLKNMLLWVLNTFSVLFGMVEIDDNPHWVKADPNLIAFLLRSKDNSDTLFLSHMDLEHLSVRNIDLGNTYLINVNLKNADFAHSLCDGLQCVAQTFENVNFEGTDWTSNKLNECQCCDTDFTGSEFTDASVMNSSFNRCKFGRADFVDCIVSNTEFKNCDFRNCFFFLYTVL